MGMSTEHRWIPGREGNAKHPPFAALLTPVGNGDQRTHRIRRAKGRPNLKRDQANDNAERKENERLDEPNDSPDYKRYGQEINEGSDEGSPGITRLVMDSSRKYQRMQRHLSYSLFGQWCHLRYWVSLQDEIHEYDGGPMTSQSTYKHDITPMNRTYPL